LIKRAPIFPERDNFGDPRRGLLLPYIVKNFLTEGSRGGRWGEGRSAFHPD
jgi:hypothetical protein